MVLLAILSAGLLGLIIYFAISSKSSRQLKIAALVALGFIAIALGVCGVILLLGPSEDPMAVPFPVLPEPQQAETASSFSIADILVFVLMIGIVGLMVYASRKEQKKQAVRVQRPQRPPPRTERTPAAPLPIEEEEFDSFDLDFENEEASKEP